MPETLVLMQLDTKLLETCLRQIKIATYSDHYVDAKIPKEMMFQRTLDSEWELCSISVGFRTQILLLHLVDSAQKFCSISVGFRTQIVLYMLDSAQKL
jgi:hypothetical protein